MTSQTITTKSYSPQHEQELRAELLTAFRNTPIPDNELFANLGLFLSRWQLCRILYMADLYKLILGTHGNIMEFGCRWGQNLALFSSLRAIHEPFNLSRKIIGFDTFSGFPNVDQKDGKDPIAQVGHYATSADYEQQLDFIMNYHEQINPNPHVKKYQLVKGDATVEAEKYFAANPQTIVALAYFDFDLYKPTVRCLELVREHMTKGSVLAFDELNMAEFPGETVALKEVFGLSRYQIRRNPNSQFQSYIVID